MKTAICAIIKDEHRFLEEWIEWHLCLGFDAIHLFEDKGSKSHEEICAKYSNVYLRRYEDDEQVRELLADQGSPNRQFDLYSWFGDSYKNTYDWVAFIDIDEFIVFNCDYTLESFCSEFEPYPAVILSWRMMSASGHIDRPKCGVMEAYTGLGVLPDIERGYAYKSFCNINRWIGMTNLHLAKGYVNTSHVQDIYKVSYDKVALNHYFTKSWEDWCDRIFKRGGTAPTHRKLADFFECNPDMEHLRDELIASVADRIPNGTYWLDKKRGLIAGGNVKKITDLNNDRI